MSTNDAQGAAQAAMRCSVAAMRMPQYDPRAPIEEVYRLVDQMKAPAELWLLADQHHNGSITQKARSAVWEADIHAFVCDWLRDRFNGVPMKHTGKTLWLEGSGAGPTAKQVTYKRRWFDQ